MQSPPLQRTLRLSALLCSALFSISACHGVDRALTDDLQVLSDLECNQGEATLIQHNTVSCNNATHFWNGQTWAKILPHPITAGIWNPEEKTLLYAHPNGTMGRVKPGQKGQKAKAPTLEPHPVKPIYRWTPPGHQNAQDHQITRFFHVHNDQFLALSASSGALISNDDGLTWETFPWIARFEGLDGSRPLEVQNLHITQDGDLVFLLYPEGKQLEAEKIQALIQEEAKSTEKGGPRVVAGSLQEQRLKVRALPLGTDYNLASAPLKKEKGLWAFIDHTQRREATRFASTDWTQSWIDNGYFDLDVVHTAHTPESLALLGLTDAGTPQLWLKGKNFDSRIAHLDPTQVSLQERPQIALAPGPQPPYLTAVHNNKKRVLLYNLSILGSDKRLLWYYIPLGLLALIALPLIVRRALQERSMKKPPARTRPIPEDPPLQVPPSDTH